MTTKRRARAVAASAVLFLLPASAGAAPPPAGATSSPATRPGTPVDRGTATGQQERARTGTGPVARAGSGADEDGPVRFSLPTESDQIAWSKPGFRFGLGFEYGRLVGLRGAPDGNMIGPSIRLGLRLDERWSLLAAFQYLYAFGGSGLSGLRYLGTLEPTWHVTRRLGLTLGLGFGGFVEGGGNRRAPDPPLQDVSYTYPDARYPMADCGGIGVAGLIRAEYMLVIGPRASTGPTVELDLQWTGCEHQTKVNDPDTSETIVRRQWWPQLGVSAAWMFAWR